MDLCCLQSPHPSVLLRPLKERVREPGKETEREREMRPVACGRHLGVHKAPRTAHIPSNPIHPSPRHSSLSPSLFLSVSFPFFFLCLLTLWWRGASLKAQNGWNAAEQIGVLKVRSQKTEQITASQLSTASEDCHYCKILNTIYFPRTFCLETSFTDGWEKYLLGCFKNTFSWLFFCRL